MKSTSRRIGFATLIVGLFASVGSVVQAQGINVAPGGVASQSTSHPAGPAANGIDGNTGNFTHTNAGDPEPTWEVDLGSVYPIERIVLHNRDSCCQDRFRDLTIFILDDAGTEVYVSPLLNELDELFGPELIDFDLIAEEGDVVEGQIVRISRTPDPLLDAGNNYLR